MTCARELTICSGAQATAPRDRVTRVEKPNVSNTLEQSPPRQGTSSTNDRLAHARMRSSRFGTEERAPLWNGPRLNCAFVAQVLGQAFAGRQPPEPSAYRRDFAPTGLLVDKTI